MRRIPGTALVCAFAACLQAGAQTVVEPGLQVEVVATGLSQPTSLAFIGDDDILVLQKADGRVRRILGGVLQPDAVLDVAVHNLSERGLLGIATDPDFINNHRVFLYYTESATGADTSQSNSTPLGNRIYRYTWNGAALVDPVLVLSLPATPGPNHNGGVIAFGPDDALYAVIGDLNRAGKLQNFPAGPDPDDTGVILRVSTDGNALPDSPFFDFATAGAPMSRYMAYGVRNSFGFTFDPLTGFLWDTENGPTFYDEVNRVVRGFNSGWTQIMGPDARDPQGQADLWSAPRSVYRDPELSWAVPIAPTAIAFVDSPVMGCGLVHGLLSGDVNCAQLYRLPVNAARDGLSFSSALLQDRVADNNSALCSAEMQEILFGSNFGTVTDLENGPDGRLYVVSISSGAVLRIGPRAGAFPDADRDGVADSCDCAASDSLAFGDPVEVPRLRVAGAVSTTLGWNSQAGEAGPGTTYRVVTGSLAALSADRGFTSACALGDALARPALADPRPDPPPGQGIYYLAGARNACGFGTYGTGARAGSPDPRADLAGRFVPACS